MSTAIITSSSYFKKIFYMHIILQLGLAFLDFYEQILKKKVWPEYEDTRISCGPILSLSSTFVLYE